MVLDPVHMEGITKHARRIKSEVDESEHRNIAGTVWNDFLNPLYNQEGEKILSPLEGQYLREIKIEEAALQETIFERSYGLDSGTINPTSFKNGIVLDVAQAAMAAVPTELDLHRKRTITTTVHSTTPVGISEKTEKLDEGNTQNILLPAPSVERFEESVVHDIALHLSESKHALSHINQIDGLLVLDGPIYPKGILNWADHPELRELLYDEGDTRDVKGNPRDIIKNYIGLVNHFVSNEIPLLGFVKNPSTQALTRTLERQESTPQTPWVNDTAFFKKILEKVGYEYNRDENGDVQRKRVRDEEHLTYTNWFRSRGGADRYVSADASLFDLERTLDPEDYEVTFFVLYEPRSDLLYRIESPYGITKDPERREQLTKWILKEVATQQGPPEAVAKADELARISKDETAALQSEFEIKFNTEQHKDYDSHRWNELY